MFDLHLTAEELTFRQVVRDFVSREIKPIALARDGEASFQDRFPWDVVVKASQLGLRTMNLSKAHGGSGAGAVLSCLVAEELAAGDIGIAVTLGHTAGLAHNYFDQVMNPEQRGRFLPDFLADDRYHLAIAMHEPDSDRGFDYFVPAIPNTGDQTTAVPDGRGNWVINGTKNFQTNGTIARLLAVRTRTERGPAAFLLPTTTAGLTRRQLDAAGRRLASWAELHFDDCVVPGENLLGQVGQLPALGFGEAGFARWAAMTLGVGRAAHEAALGYAKIRVQGGKPILQHQGMGLALGDMAINLEVGRTLALQAAWACDHPGVRAEADLPDQPLGLMAILFASQVSLDVAVKASTLLGGAGLMRELPMHKYIRDATVYLHAQPKELQALKLAESLAGFRRQAAVVSN